jgi:hypothetical protein
MCGSPDALKFWPKEFRHVASSSLPSFTKKKKRTHPPTIEDLVIVAKTIESTSTHGNYPLMHNLAPAMATHGSFTLLPMGLPAAAIPILQQVPPSLE